MPEEANGAVTSNQSGRRIKAFKRKLGKRKGISLIRYSWVQARQKAVTTLQTPGWMSKTQMNPLLRCLYQRWLAGYPVRSWGQGRHSASLQRIGGNQELARTSKQKCFELQALLEEWKAYRNQVEESAKQIQVLQVQRQRLRRDMETLQEEKDSEITSTRDKLLSAQDEIFAPSSSSNGCVWADTDFVSLQEELKKVRAEPKGWRTAACE